MCHVAMENIKKLSIQMDNSASIANQCKSSCTSPEPCAQQLSPHLNKTNPTQETPQTTRRTNTLSHTQSSGNYHEAHASITHTKFIYTVVFMNAACQTSTTVQPTQCTWRCFGWFLVASFVLEHLPRQYRSQKQLLNILPK